MGGKHPEPLQEAEEHLEPRAVESLYRGPRGLEVAALGSPAKTRLDWDVLEEDFTALNAMLDVEKNKKWKRAAEAKKANEENQDWEKARAAEVSSKEVEPVEAGQACKS